MYQAVLLTRDGGDIVEILSGWVDLETANMIAEKATYNRNRYATHIMEF